jgi:hypothetical protein
VAAVTTLLNPYDVIAHNTDKAYLRGLEAAGIAVVPTVWVGPEDVLDGFPPVFPTVRSSSSRASRPAVATPCVRPTAAWPSPTSGD